MRGFGGMLAFDLGSLEAARRLLNSVRLMALAESLGGVETLISHPATMTHASVPAERRAALGITDGLVRISAGIEDIDDLQDDLVAGPGRRLIRLSSRCPISSICCSTPTTYLLDIVATYGRGSTRILFAIVFAETGLVVTPFLPGDSLLFAAGAHRRDRRLDIRAATAAAGRGDRRRRGELRGRPGDRARVIAEGAAAIRAGGRWINPAYIERGARVLRALRRQGGGARPVHADRADVRAVRRRRRRDGLSVVRALQHHRRGGLGGVCASAPAISSATCRSIKENFSLVAIGIVFVSLLPMAHRDFMRHRARPSAPLTQPR